jgi:hypothetical protein
VRLQVGDCHVHPAERWGQEARCRVADALEQDDRQRATGRRRECCPIGRPRASWRGKSRPLSCVVRCCRGDGASTSLGGWQKGSGSFRHLGSAAPCHFKSGVAIFCRYLRLNRPAQDLAYEFPPNG